MRYAIVDVAKRELRSYSAQDETGHEAMRSVGLESGRIDHGSVKRGIAILVAEDGLYQDPDGGQYFSMGGRLYNGNAVLFAYGDFGETVDLNLSAVPAPSFYANRDEIEDAIGKGEIVRPNAEINGVEMWRWPADDSWLGEVWKERK